MTARPIRRNAQTPDRNGKIFYTSTTSLSHISKVLPDKAPIPGEGNELSELMDSFLHTLKPDSRNIFMRRYWFMDSVSEIAEASGFGLSKVKMSLSRTREQLKLFLEQEGYRL